MGLIATLLQPFLAIERSPLAFTIAFLVLIALLVVGNVLKQLLFKIPTDPPLVFHLFPFIGSTITYGIDPVKFFFNCKEKVRAGRGYAVRRIAD